MSHLTATESMLEQLRGIVEPVEIRDARGKVLGLYTPVLSPEEEELYRKAATLFDPEELDRIEASEHEGRPLAEVWERIRASEKGR